MLRSLLPVSGRKHRQPKGLEQVFQELSDYVRSQGGRVPLTVLMDDVCLKCDGTVLDRDEIRGLLDRHDVPLVCDVWDRLIHVPTEIEVFTETVGQATSLELSIDSFLTYLESLDAELIGYGNAMYDCFDISSTPQFEFVRATCLEVEERMKELKQVHELWDNMFYMYFEFAEKRKDSESLQYLLSWGRNHSPGLDQFAEEALEVL